MDFTTLALHIFRVLITSGVAYAIFLCVLVIPAIQSQVIYLNKVTLTGSKDVYIPEQWGFLRNQLLKEPPGLASEVSARLSLKLLRDDPEALLVIYLHGAAGTLGSGYRPPSYRVLYAGAPGKIHVVAVDYRGFGRSTGSPSEEGLLIDALTLANWAINTAGIPPSRIVFFAQSLGTAVGIALAHRMALQSPPVLFAGMVFVAPFADVETLTATYKVAGTIPILSPVAYFPRLLAFLNTFIKSKWPSKTRLVEFIRLHETMETISGAPQATYHITLIHAQDDYDIPWSHTEQLFWHAVNGSTPTGISYEALEERKANEKIDLGAAGWVVDWRTEKGVIREQIIKHGMHDITMSYPVVSLAVLRAFDDAASFAKP